MHNIDLIHLWENSVITAYNVPIAFNEQRQCFEVYPRLSSIQFESSLLVYSGA